ncbi:ferroptosis suppressor protein 1-like [Patiria miniata]|uniref:Ferroptosis suppressor protein 1 n=1 Tax=Patiria miniata TaxID=46514 RepID=A0A913ZJ65_PATMI|nr:ferroptosis suppressor protein 1-like [Patiria miniata]XP_038051095.1 ferroptosis suppressor protein 1-like [Patiria miniata]
MGVSQSCDDALREKHVVVVGGGYGGTVVALKLQGKCKITLIDPKEAFHHCLGALRSCTEDGFARKVFIPYAPAFEENFKRGMVEEVDPTAKKVKLVGGEEVSYDYLVMATGSMGAFPCRVSGADDTSVYVEKYTDMLQKIKASTDIVVVGGGAVGVEMAGEIATDFSDKQVTIVHSRDYLVEGDLAPKFRKGLEDQLRAKGVKLVLGEKVSNLSELPQDFSSRCTVKTDKGTEIEADVVLVCVGLPCNSSAYATSLSNCMEKTGHLKVNQFLQVEGLDDVLAIGDCCNVDPLKLAYMAAMQAELAVKNLELLAQGKTKLKAWAAPGTLMVVPVGRNGGMFQKDSLVFGSFLSRKIKSEALFTSRYWRDMKQKVPEAEDSEV